MKVVIISVFYIINYNSYKYEVKDLNSKLEGVYYTNYKYNIKDTINIK